MGVVAGRKDQVRPGEVLQDPLSPSVLHPVRDSEETSGPSKRLPPTSDELQDGVEALLDPQKPIVLAPAARRHGYGGTPVPVHAEPLSPRRRVQHKQHGRARRVDVLDPRM